ncbi:type II secretion system F family protein [Georgenia thermotolerans]|uniref:Type II secretion system protein F n=1 Tax=Georgenia thermotolerans TaxID=527326 RepID=A0A7J5UQ00_9MICO|nr:type II secretion system F family protein [Georgenia thermotolerans]KAE8764023.1 type II secretion system protein F [Georgenia thermotolerans]
MGAVAGLLLGAGLLSVWFSLFERPAPRVRARPTWTQRTQDLLVQAGAPTVRPVSLVLTSAGLALATLVIGVAVTASPPIALCFAVIVGAAPTLLVRSRARRRRAALRAVWPEVIDHLVSAVRAGLSLPEALSALGERGPEEVRAEFRSFARDYRATGRFDDALAALKARLADPVADRIVEALRLTREVGGTDLGRLLRTLAQMLREDLRTRGELEARQSWTVNGARMAVAAPWVVLLLLSTRAETAAAYNTAAGVVVLGAGAGCSVLAYWLMVRIGRLPEEERVLR